MLQTPSPAAHGDHARARWIALVVVTATAAVLVPIWGVRFVPSTDGPQHLLAAHVAVHYGDPAFDYARWLVPSSTLTPILGDRALRGLLRLGLPPWRANQVLLSLWIVGFAAASAYLLSWRRREGAFLAVPALLLVHGFLQGMGFLGFLLSMPLALTALGLLLRGPVRGGWRAVALGALLLAAVLAHPFAIVVMAPLLLLLTWASGSSWLLVGAATTPSLAVLVLRSSSTWVHAGQ